MALQGMNNCYKCSPDGSTCLECSPYDSGMDSHCRACRDPHCVMCGDDYTKCSPGDCQYPGYSLGSNGRCQKVRMQDSQGVRARTACAFGTLGEAGAVKGKGCWLLLLQPASQPGAQARNGAARMHSCPVAFVPAYCFQLLSAQPNLNDAPL